MGFSLSEECASFIAGLLDKNPTNRLGSNGDIDEVLAHPFMKKLDSQ